MNGQEDEHEHLGVVQLEKNDEHENIDHEGEHEKMKNGKNIMIKTRNSKIKRGRRREEK